MSTLTTVQGFGLYRKREGDDNFATPKVLFDAFDRYLFATDGVHFQRDVCATALTAKCRKFWDKETNALTQIWTPRDGPFFCNPPYSRPKGVKAWGASGLHPWVKKMFETAQNGAIVGGVLPVWTSDLWFHQFCRRCEIIFLRTRVTFISPRRYGDDGPASFPSMFLIFRPNDDEIGLRVRWDTHPTKDNPRIIRPNPPMPRQKPATPKVGIVISLCDRTGNMARPWADAGYTCYCVDSQHAPGEHRKGNIVRVGADIRTWQPPGLPRAITFAFPPCTNLAVSGAAHFKKKGAQGLTDGLELVEACRQICVSSSAPWMIENPVSTLASYWEPDFKFDPMDFGGYEGGEDDGYAKKTRLWVGNGFRFPEPRPVAMTKPNHILNMSSDRSDLRAITPPGFARAVYEANVLA